MPAKFRDLTAEETAAVRTFATQYGRNWKAALRAAWLGERHKGLPMVDKEGATLRRLRNEAGMVHRWLEAFRLPKAAPLDSVAKLVDTADAAEAAGFASFNPGPHLLVEAPDGMFCVSIRTSAGRLLTIQLLSDEDLAKGSANCADISYHTSGKVWDNNGTPVPMFDLAVWAGGQTAFDSRNAEGRSPTCVTLFMHDHSEGGESVAKDR